MPIQTRNFVDQSDTGSALSALATFVNNQETRPTNLANAAGQTLTAAQTLSGIILRSGAAAVSDTTPTAAQLVAAFLGVQVGTTILLTIRNNNTGTLTLAAGTGVTLNGTTTIATVFSRVYAVQFTNVTPGAEAVTITGLFTAAV